jgi:hypothetical protein
MVEPCPTSSIFCFFASICGNKLPITIWQSDAVSIF